MSDDLNQFSEPVPTEQPVQNEPTPEVVAETACVSQTAMPEPPSANAAPTCSLRKGLASLLAFTLRIIIVLIAAISLFAYVDSQMSGPGEGAEEAPSVATEDDVDYSIVKGEDEENAIAIVDIKGVIGKTADVFFDDDQIVIGADSNAIGLILQTIADDESVKVIVLDMDTPGGEIVASDEIYHELKRCSEKGKKIVTCMGSTAASGGYFIACASDWIVANRLTTTGSIGVISSFYNYKRLADLVGVKHMVFKSGAKKDLMDEFRDITPEESAFLQKQINDCYVEFATIVAENRAAFKTADDVRNSIIGDARTVSGKEALALGLVDELGYMHNALDKACSFIPAENVKEGGPQIRHYWLGSKDDDGTVFEMRARRTPQSVNLNLPLCGVSLQPGRLYAILPACAR